jgi:hypothetical protein
MNESQVAVYFTQLVYRLLPYLAATVGITLISFTPLGRAAVTWLKGHVNRGRAAELAGEIERLRQELAEVHERQDFTERHLAGPGLVITRDRAPTPATGEARVPTPV